MGSGLAAVFDVLAQALVCAIIDLSSCVLAVELSEELLP